MFKIIDAKIEISPFRVDGIVEAFSEEDLYPIGVFFPFSIGEEGDKFFFQYKEVESTGLQIPLSYNDVVYWLDAETGFLFKSPTSCPFYSPCLNVQLIVESFGMNWDIFLKVAMEGFTSSGIPLIKACEKLAEEGIFLFDKESSLVSNYLRYTGEGGKDTLSDDLKYSLEKFLGFISDSVYEASFNVLGLLGATQRRKGADFMDYLLLDNSFQPSVLKDCMGAIEMQSSTEEAKKKVKDSGVMEVLKKSHKRFDTESMTDFFSEMSRTSGAADPLEFFPFEVVTSQLSKVVRRFKIKGVV